MTVVGSRLHPLRGPSAARYTIHKTPANPRSVASGVPFGVMLRKRLTTFKRRAGEKLYLLPRRMRTDADVCERTGHSSDTAQGAIAAPASRAPRSSWRPPYHCRLLFRAPAGLIQPVPFLPRLLCAPDRAAHNASPSAPLGIRETRSASPPVSQTKSCCFSFDSFIFIVLLLMADGPSTTLHAPSTTFCMDSLRCAPCDACALFSHTCMAVRTSAIRYSPSCGRVLRFVVEVTLK